MAQEVCVPDIGDFASVDVIELLVKPGDTVNIDDPLVTLESDKASMDIPAPVAGIVLALKVAIGDKVAQGSPLLTLDVVDGVADSNSEALSEPIEPVSSSAHPAQSDQPPPAAIADPASELIYASPSVRRIAREQKIDLQRVAASGPKGRITVDDVHAFMAADSPAASASTDSMSIEPLPTVDFSQFGDIEQQPLTRIQKLSGPFLRRVWLNVPMVTHHDEADMTDLEAFRQSLKPEAEQRGVRVTGLVFIMKALACSLAEFPKLNSALAADGQSLLLKKYIHIGVAVDTPNGLVVPVFRDVDKKSIYALSGELGEISKKARDGKLTPKDLSGGCISISSLGGIGGTAFTPIVNAPEVAILGVTRSQMKPVWNGSEFVPRLMTPLDLTYDHRVVDGALAARFMVHLCANLADFRRILL